MSNGPIGLGEPFAPLERLNIKFEKNDYCTFKGDCREYLNITTLCGHCIWMQKFDMPKLVEGVVLENGNGKLE